MAPVAARWINHRILRYADVILMLAEASNELGDGATAQGNLELIRTPRAVGWELHATICYAMITFTKSAAMRRPSKMKEDLSSPWKGYRFYDW